MSRYCYFDLTEKETGSARVRETSKLKALEPGCLVQIPAPTMTNHVTLGKVLDLPVSVSSTVKWGQQQHLFHKTARSFNDLGDIRAYRNARQRVKLCTDFC